MNLDLLERLIDASKQAHNEYTKSKIGLVTIFGNEESATLTTTANNETVTTTIKINGGKIDD